MGPTIIAIIISLINYIKNTNSSYIVFLERDGFIPKIVFEKMKSYFNLENIVTDDLLLNRDIINVISLNSNKDYTLRHNYPLKVDTFLLYFFNDKNQIKKIKNILLNNKNIKGTDLVKDIDFPFLIDTVKKYFINRAEIEKEIVNYLNKKIEPLNGKNVVIFDIGYQGSADSILSDIIPFTKNLNRFYIANLFNNFHHNNYYSYLESFFWNPDFKVLYPGISELCLFRPLKKKETAKLHKLNKLADFIFYDSEDYTDSIIIQEGIINFVEDILNKNFYIIKDMKISRNFIENLLKYINKVIIPLQQVKMLYNYIY